MPAFQSEKMSLDAHPPAAGRSRLEASADWIVGVLEIDSI